MARGDGAMERLRADLLRRARNERRATEHVERDIGVAQMNTAGDSAVAEASTSRQRAILDRIPAFPRRPSRQTTNDDGPKSPEQPPQRLTFASSRYSESGHPPSSLPSPIPMGPLEPQRPLPPQPVASTARPRDSLSRLGYGDNPPERPMIVAISPEDQEQPPSQDAGSRDSRKPHPKKFMFCFPWVKSRRVRSQILTCFVSGMFLATLLARRAPLRDGLARRQDTEATRRRRLPEMLGPGGYVVPPKPIPVVLARDEEAAGIESEAAQSRPPAYGLWRESVRVDPNRLFWQRNEAAEGEPRRPDTATGPRPPSYASDDGISYVVEARPRSMAPPPQTYTVSVAGVPPVPPTRIAGD
ncbi:hypothetical protein MAC_04498 [Metarhizium acridum CQMa 102]|uniref:Uncharacterized protein n=1 Tax=Metarhizium acridum (strain CQMa 102) TaxID=655827 RepID=E9E3Q4_METAQ|nr:uncharacterized protein MAC_04498 [Metarhizium acridum CQMa 102]EFY89479.1 hypothetical protein MAC_04498 [Metarhizium acridum CQMa 102]